MASGFLHVLLKLQQHHPTGSPGVSVPILVVISVGNYYSPILEHPCPLLQNLSRMQAFLVATKSVI